MLTAFERELGEMIEAEESIFVLFDGLVSSTGSRDGEATVLARASARMAAGDTRFTSVR